MKSVWQRRCRIRGVDAPLRVLRTDLINRRRCDDRGEFGEKFGMILAQISIDGSVRSQLAHIRRRDHQMQNIVAVPRFHPLQVLLDVSISRSMRAIWSAVRPPTFFGLFRL